MKNNAVMNTCSCDTYNYIHDEQLKVKKDKRNQLMDLSKLIASVFVLFIHVKFPGEFGQNVEYIARFAVPMFFMISGYFNYGASSCAVAKRIKHILTLIIISTGADLIWSCVQIELVGGSTVALLIQFIPESDEIVNFLIQHVHPYAGHLWYLNAIAACYMVFYAFVRFGEEIHADHKPFYFLSAVTFIMMFVFDNVWLSAIIVSPVSTRNGWLGGIPLFGTGLFLRQYHKQIISAFRLTEWKLAATILIGLCFALLQANTVGAGLVPMGTLFTVLALMLLLAMHPQIADTQRWTGRLLNMCGFLSTFVYIMHMVIYSMYKQLLLPCAAEVLQEKEPWLQPLIVAAMTLAAGCIWYGVVWFWKQRIKPRLIRETI